MAPKTESEVHAAMQAMEGRLSRKIERLETKIKDLEEISGISETRIVALEVRAGGLETRIRVPEGEVRRAVDKITREIKRQEERCRARAHGARQGPKRKASTIGDGAEVDPPCRPEDEDTWYIDDDLVTSMLHSRGLDPSGSASEKKARLVRTF